MLLFAQYPINLIGVLVAAVAAMAVGFAWYSPLLFGKQWMALMKLTAKDMEKAKKDMGMMYGLSFLATLVMTYVLAYFMRRMAVSDLSQAVLLGFWAWIGFVAPVQLTDVIFGSKRWNLFFLNTGYQLTSIVVAALVLTFLV